MKAIHFTPIGQQTTTPNHASAAISDFDALTEGSWLRPGSPGTIARLMVYLSPPKLVRSRLEAQARYPSIPERVRRRLGCINPRLLVVEDDPAHPRFTTAAGPTGFDTASLKWALETSDRVVLWAGEAVAPGAREMIEPWLLAGQNVAIIATQPPQTDPWLARVLEVCKRPPSLMCCRPAGVPGAREMIEPWLLAGQNVTIIATQPTDPLRVRGEALRNAVFQHIADLKADFPFIVVGVPGGELPEDLFTTPRQIGTFTVERKCADDTLNSPLLEGYVSRRGGLIFACEALADYRRLTSREATFAARGYRLWGLTDAGGVG
ncbi:hypothetical protein HL658_01380 [Azospirillum sp. RWY-5-1]|uniref:Uncharacterized protein n=1 Tax=Azospirillum oleiclasticum TaxID=2735135 RepID=A0ABX2T208_9PROT|nr:hypothetical protein [Azospirillum oleiclasticum]NYZ11185.1 hypothetical protein [Azospirillum oleiclasticum]NYZ18347.1 hypothetical protein [Azospirillum oleiclasticum]